MSDPDATTRAGGEPSESTGDDTEAISKAALQRERARREAVERALEDDEQPRRRRREPDVDDEGRDPVPWRRRLLLLALVAAATVVLYALGARNHGRFHLVCLPDQVEPQRGAWLPWGREPLEGETYAPVKLPPEADCASRTFESHEQLDLALCNLLLARVEANLRGRSPKLDEVGAKLAQALRLARGQPERRARLAKLGGNLEYLRGRAAVEQAGGALKQAMEHFQEARRRGAPLARDGARWNPAPGGAAAAPRRPGRRARERPRAREPAQERAGHPAARRRDPAPQGGRAALTAGYSPSTSAIRCFSSA